jgi:hypothetical protein
MGDYTELKRLLEGCKESNCADASDFGRRIADLYDYLDPETIAGLVAENERLTGFVVHRRAQADQYDEALTKVADQRDQLKAETRCCVFVVSVLMLTSRPWPKRMCSTPGYARSATSRATTLWPCT